MTQADLIIIGAGPGGYDTAVFAASQGLHTVIVEAAEAGGTCLNRGCIPTKCFCRHADLLRDIQQASAFGVTIPSWSFDITKAVERKDQVVAALRSGIDTLLQAPLITRVNGKARFTGPHTVHIDCPEGTTGEETDYTAPRIIIATGAASKFLPIPGHDLPRVYTSTEMLTITSLPRRLCIIGGGVIGLEFASIFQAFGSEVTVLEFCKELLPGFDSDIAKRLRTSLKQQGIQVICQAAVASISDAGDHYEVGYRFHDAEQSAPADIVLMAVGRQADTSSLGLDAAGIQTERRGITTDEDFRTNVEGVYAVGDVNGKCQLAHAATFQGRHAVRHMLGIPDPTDFSIIPAAVFTHPEVATVGLTSDYCKAQGMDFTVHKSFFRANGKALAMGEPEGLVKILADAEGHLLGAHIIGPHASDLIQEVTTLLQDHASVERLSDIIHAHPTLSEVVMDAARH